MSNLGTRIPARGRARISFWKGTNTTRPSSTADPSFSTTSRGTSSSATSSTTTPTSSPTSSRSSEAFRAVVAPRARRRGGRRQRRGRPRVLERLREARARVVRVSIEDPGADFAARGHQFFSGRHGLHARWRPGRAAGTPLLAPGRHSQPAQRPGRDRRSRAASASRRGDRAVALRASKGSAAASR